MCTLYKGLQGACRVKKLFHTLLPNTQMGRASLEYHEDFALSPLGIQREALEERTYTHEAVWKNAVEQIDNKE